MKDWILYNWKLIPWAIFIVGSTIATLLFSLQKNKNNPEYKEVTACCLKLVKEFEGIELDSKEAKFIPIGAKARTSSYSGLMMVWEKELSGISVKCSIVSRGYKVKYFSINGEDKTDLVRREEREK